MPTHEPAVDGAQHRVVRGGLAERAASATTEAPRRATSVLAAKPCAVSAAATAVIAPARCALRVGRAALLGEAQPVGLADLERHRLGALGPEQLQGPLEEGDEELVGCASRRRVGERVLGRRVGLRGPPDAARRRRRRDVPGGDEPVEVVARDVRVDRVRRGHVARPSRPGASRRCRKIARRVGSPKALDSAATTALNAAGSSGTDGAATPFTGTRADIAQ